MSNDIPREHVDAPPWRLIQDYVLILPDPEKRETASGILIPSTSEAARSWTGVIVAVGPGCWRCNVETRAESEKLRKSTGRGLQGNRRWYGVDSEVGMVVAYDMRSIVELEHPDETGKLVKYHMIRDEGVWLEFERGADFELGRPVAYEPYYKPGEELGG